MDLLRRQHERSSLNTSAVIRTEDDSFTASCVVHNLSESGAKLMVEQREPLPTEFILFLRPSSSVGRRCQTIWRIGNKVGVRFVAIADLSQRKA
jgi:PilZ domain